MNLKSFPIADRAALVSAFVMLIAFVFLPWAYLAIDGGMEKGDSNNTSFPQSQRLGIITIDDASKSRTTGINLLLEGSDIELARIMKPEMQTTYIIDPPEEEEIEIYLTAVIEPLSSFGYYSLFLVPLTAIGGGALILWGRNSSVNQKRRLWFRRGLVFTSWLSYFSFLDVSLFGKFNMVGIGFWVALVSSFGILAGRSTT